MNSPYRNGQSRSPFSGPILAILWIFQLLLFATAVSTLSLLVGTLRNSPFILFGVVEDMGTTLGVVPTSYIFMLTIAATLTLITCIEVFLYFHQGLTPPIFFYSTLFKITNWTVVVGLNIWSITRPWLSNSQTEFPKVIEYYRTYLWVMLGGALGVFLLLIPSFAYSISVFVRYRRHIKGLAEASINQSVV